MSIFFLLAFDDEHCWEPYMPHGNFSSSDISYQLGTTVTFTCSPGFVMEQGSGTIECIDPSNPHWNDSEPVCKGNFHSFSFGCTLHSTIFASVYYQIPFTLLAPVQTRKLQPNLLMHRKSTCTHTLLADCFLFPSHGHRELWDVSLLSFGDWQVNSLSHTPFTHSRYGAIDLAHTVIQTN